MNLTANNNIFNKETDLVQNILTNVIKYCSNEVIITDEKFNIIYHNSKHLSDDEKITLFDVINGYMNENIRINIENFKNSQKNHMFLKLIFNDENNFQNVPVDVHFCKIKDKKNKLRGYSILIQDITEEIKNRIQKETFIDILSHDIKNPIRANIQILELILNNKFGKIESNLKIILDELLNSCRFMQYMTDNLLIKYKNEFNLTELQKQKYSMVKLVKDKCTQLMNILDRKKQTIEFTVSGNNHDVYIDVDEMEKVVNNLIINASEQSVENSKILIQINSNNDNINVSFTDFGYQQKKENLDEIFEEYIACSNKFRKVGFSLELYNCKKIIEAHNGHICAKNVNETGTSIIFTLPLCI